MAGSVLTSRTPEAARIREEIDSLAAIDVDPPRPAVGAAAQALRRVVQGAQRPHEGSSDRRDRAGRRRASPHLLLADPGHVAIRAGSQLFETTLPVFALMLIGLYVLLRSLAAALTSRRRLAELRAERRRRRARSDTQRALLDLAAGNWKRSEELLTRSAGDAESPVVNYLVAARAADLQDAVARRDDWLAHAQEGRARGARPRS